MPQVERREQLWYDEGIVPELDGRVETRKTEPSRRRESHEEETVLRGEQERVRRFARRTGCGGPVARGSVGQDPRAKSAGPRTQGEAPPAIRASKPNGLNLIVIICDTFRYDYLHCNGNDRIRTPNLDALAEEGTSLYELLCGRAADHSRAAGHAHRAEHPSRPGEMEAAAHGDVTLAEILAKAGFSRGFIADTPHYFKPDMNFHRGFSSWQWIRGQESDPYVERPAQARSVPRPTCRAHAQSRHTARTPPSIS